ncbi:hypothetical protein [Streptomyces sp. NBC_00203]
MFCPPAPFMPITMRAEWRRKHPQEDALPKHLREQEEKPRHARDGEETHA